MRGLLLALAMLWGAPAHAETGHGDAPRRSEGVLSAIEAPPLASIERDVIRFSSTPSRGRRGYVMTFVGAAGGAWAEAVWLEHRPQTGWSVTRRERTQLDSSEYETLAQLVDSNLARGEPTATDPVVVCADGPGYLTERLMDGDAQWMAGQCGENHPNNAIAAALFRWLLVSFN